MKIDRLMTRSPKTCRPTDTLQTAAMLMWNADIGFVPVVADGGRLVGVITDRDVCMAAGLCDAKLSEISIEAAMSKDVHCCRPNDTADAAERLMETYCVRRLPVIDDRGELVGVLTLGDLAREARREQGEHLVRAISDALTVETLATICAPRGSSQRAAA